MKTYTCALCGEDTAWDQPHDCKADCAPGRSTGVVPPPDEKCDRQADLPHSAERSRPSSFQETFEFCKRRAEAMDDERLWETAHDVRDRLFDMGLHVAAAVLDEFIYRNTPGGAVASEASGRRNVKDMPRRESI